MTTDRRLAQPDDEEDVTVRTTWRADQTDEVEPRRRPRGPRRMAAGALAVTALVCVGAACSSDDDSDAADGAVVADTTPSTAPGTTASTAAPDAGTTEATGAPSAEGPADAFAAVSIAAEAGPGTVVDLDREDGRWEVEVLTVDGAGVEIHVDVATGEVLDRRDESVPQPPAIPIEQAMTTALERVPEGEITQVELDDDDGRLVWQVEIDRPGDDDVDVDVDATTGEVVEVDD